MERASSDFGRCFKQRSKSEEARSIVACITRIDRLSNRWKRLYTNCAQNAPEVAILRSKIEKFSGRGHCLPSPHSLTLYVEVVFA